MSIRYMVHSDKWGETTRNTEKKQQQQTKKKKKQFYEILMGYIYWQANRNSSTLRGLEGESLRLTDNHEVQRYMHTQTQKHTHARNCEIMTGQEEGQPLSYLQRTLRAVSGCIRRMPDTWQTCLHMDFSRLVDLNTPIIRGYRGSYVSKR